MLKTPSLLTIAVSLAAFTSFSHGAIILQESFDYGGSLSQGDAVGGSNGGTGWSAAWNPNAGTFEATGLTHSFIDASGGALLAGSDFNNDREYSLTGLTDNGDVQWSSFLIQFNGAPNADRFYIFTAGSSGDGFGVDFGGNATTIDFDLTTNGTNSGSSALGSDANGNTSLIILKHTWGPTDMTGTEVTVDAWLNPSSVSSEGALGTAVSRTTTLTPGELTGGIYPRTGSSNYILDEYRMGDSLSNVAIPEPSTVVLLGLGLGSVFMLRRRRA